GIPRLQRLHDADRYGFLAVVEMHEATDFPGLVQLETFLLEPADPQHAHQQATHMRVVKAELVGHRTSLSSVDRSPSGSPSSRALSRRRMILPLRVRGRPGVKSISFGATVAPRRLRAWPSRSRR